MKVIDSIWFTNRDGTTGVVLGEDEFKQQAYISLVEGFSRDEDEEYVLQYGSKLTKQQAYGFFPNSLNTDGMYK